MYEIDQTKKREEELNLKMLQDSAVRMNRTLLPARDDIGHVIGDDEIDLKDDKDDKDRKDNKDADLAGSLQDDLTQISHYYVDPEDSKSQDNLLKLLDKTSADLKQRHLADKQSLESEISDLTRDIAQDEKRIKELERKGNAIDQAEKVELQQLQYDQNRNSAKLSMARMKKQKVS